MITARSNFRAKARECVAAARRLLGVPDARSARYACLELRTAIEYIAYDLLETYEEQLPDDAFKKWEPRKVIAQLLAADIDADQSPVLFVGIESKYGVAPPPERMHSLGQDNRLRMSEADQLHALMSRFLHAPTVYQTTTGSAPSVADMVSAATSVADRCDQVLNSPVFNVTIGQLKQLTCSACAHVFVRNAKTLGANVGVRCPRRKCGALHRVGYDAGGDPMLQLVVTKYRCRSSECGATNSVGAHLVKVGAEFNCGKCGETNKVIFGTVLQNEPPPNYE